MLQILLLTEKEITAVLGMVLRDSGQQSRSTENFTGYILVAYVCLITSNQGEDFL
jgi:hypothetical protein